MFLCGDLMPFVVTFGVGGLVSVSGFWICGYGTVSAAFLVV